MTNPHFEIAAQLIAQAYAKPERSSYDFSISGTKNVRLAQREGVVAAGGGFDHRWDLFIVWPTGEVSMRIIELDARAEDVRQIALELLQRSSSSMSRSAQ